VTLMTYMHVTVAMYVDLKGTMTVDLRIRTC